MGAVKRMGDSAVRLATRVSNYSQKKFPIVKKYAMVELVPPTPVQAVQGLGEAVSLVAKTAGGGWKNLTVFEACVAGAVMWECAMWFFIGEVIARRNLRGYNIEGAFYPKITPFLSPSNNVAFDAWKLDVPEPEKK
ncbi:ATP synthase subunit g [Mactra antiquata]